jgi:uncharacterized protein (TIGR00299 family) protein
MTTLAFDGRTGASGDMILGALVAAGADPDVLSPVENALDVEYRVGETTKNGIHATTVDVVVGNDGDASDGHAHGNAGDDHDHSHGHDSDDHDHPHDHSHAHAEGRGPHRSYTECVDVVEGMDLPSRVESNATAVFRLLGEAEARVHGTDLESTAFHEVGADDAIADIVGAALLFDDLDPDRVVTTSVAAGGGTVEMSHGVYPVPAPAVAYLAESADWRLAGGPLETELLTPTGAAVLAHYATGVGSLPSMDVEASGYGAGRKSFENHPNVLRATVGETAGRLERDDIVVLETNLDDVTPEVLGGLQERLSEAGARDVTVLPTAMKKSRPGHLVKVIAKPGDAQAVARRLAAETGTLGVRETAAGHRWIADREFVTATLLVDGERRAIGVKIGRDDAGAAFDVSAEYDDAAAVAGETGLPVREVTRRAEAAAHDGGALDDHLLHVVEADRWAAVEEAYRPDSLAEAGVVHLSPADRVVGVAQHDHLDADDPRLLVVDPGAADAEVRYEEMPSGAFPHLYGPLPTGAVVDVVPFPREDDRYRLPDALRE